MEGDAMNPLISWMAAWILFCGGVALTSIVIGAYLVRADQSRIYPMTPRQRHLEVISVKAFVFAVMGMVLGCIGLFICGYGR